MNSIATRHAGLSAVISKLEQQKEELSVVYSTAINKGEKVENIKTIYLALKDTDKRLRELMQCSNTITQ